MNQSALVGGALLAGFVLFLAARDRLSVYGNVIFGSAAPAPAPQSNATSGNGNVAGSGADNSSSPSLGKLLNPFDWSLPDMPSIPDMGHMGF